VEAMQEAKGSIRVALGQCPEPLAKVYRLKNEEHQSEYHPDKRHEVEPPERRILVPSPSSIPLEQVEPSESGHKRDHASLSRETVTKATPPIQSTTPTTWRTLAKTSNPALVKIVPP